MQTIRNASVAARLLSAAPFEGSTQAQTATQPATAKPPSRAGEQIATQDLAAAAGFAFRNADSLAVDTKGYSLWGSSAGARMVAFIGSHGTARYGGPELPRPAAVVMAYTAHADIGKSEPPTFAIVGPRDGIAPPASVERRVEALRRLGTNVDHRLYSGVGHGFGLGIGTSAEGWLSEAIAFWKQHRTR